MPKKRRTYAPEVMERLREGVLRQIAITPCDIEELAFFLMSDPEPVADCVRELREAGQVVSLKLHGRGGSFFALPDWRDEGLTDFGFLRVARDFGGQIYDSGEAAGESPL